MRFDDDAVAIEGIKLGVRGFLLKDVSLDQLADAVRTVAAGGTLFNPAITERVVRGLARLGAKVPASAVPVALTKRELDVLGLIASGRSNREIADALGTAEATVKNQASSIFSKLGVRDRTRAVEDRRAEPIISAEGIEARIDEGGRAVDQGV